MNDQEKQPEVNPALLEKISLLETTPPRDPLLASRTREKFLAAVEGSPQAAPAAAPGWFGRLFKSGQGEGVGLYTGTRKFAFSTLAAIIFALVVLFGGVSATAFASQSALPGDALYPVKTRLEQTQVSLANDAYKRARLYLEFAQRRLDEITELLAQGRTNDVEFASNEFENYIQNVMVASQIVQLADDARSAELNRLVSQALLDYASALKSVLVEAPEVVKPVVEKAMLASQEGAGEETEIFGVVASITDTQVEIDGKIYMITDLSEIDDFIQAGDSVKLHVITTSDGMVIVRELELSGMMGEDSGISEDDYSSGSLGENANEGQNENGSWEDSNDNSSGENENENLNSNGSEEYSDEDYSNSNYSEDDHNSNDNSGSDSSNESDEEHSNENSSQDHSNENDNESHEDSNSNESGNTNINGDD